MLIGYKRGQGSIVLRIKILNSSLSTGAGLTGLTNASTGLIISTIADNEAASTAYTVAGSNVETITTLGTYAAPTSGKCRFKEVDATNHKGVYEIQLADARYAVSSAKSLLVSVSGATNAAETDVVIPLRDLDPYDSVRGGLTSLPTAAPAANGGLPTVDGSNRIAGIQGTINNLNNLDVPVSSVSAAAVVFASGTVVSSSGTQTILDTGAVAIAGYYVGARIRISGGTGISQERIITDYTASRVATHAEWTTTPDATSTYVVEAARTALASAEGDGLVFTGPAGASEIAICNMALSHLGIGKEIADLETENSQEAAACRRFFAEARDNTLRDFPWPFAKKLSALALVEEDPNDEWGYSYRAPSDFVRLVRILSGVRNDTAQSRVPYKVGRDTSGLLIFTDKEEAEVEYIMRETDPTRYPSDFIMALSLRLASYIAPRLTAGDPYKLGDRALQLHALEVGRAKESSVDEEQDEQLPDSELIRERE